MIIDTELLLKVKGARIPWYYFNFYRMEKGRTRL